VNEADAVETTNDTGEYERPFLPNHVLDEVGVIFLVVGIIMIIASLRRPEQLYLPKIFFAGMIEMTHLFFPLFGTLVILGLIGFLIVLPFLDRKEGRHPIKRLLWVMVMLGFIGFFLLFTILGF